MENKTEKAKTVEFSKVDQIIANTGYWDIPLSAIEKFDKAQKANVVKTKFFRSSLKQIEDIMKTKW